jgi:hypothetical protein
MSKDDFVLLGTWAGGIFFGLLLLTGLVDLAGAHIVAIFTGIASLLGSGAAAVTVFAGWSRRVLIQASGVFDCLESLRVRIDAERKQRLSVTNAELVAAQREAAAATIEVQRLQAEHEAAARAAKQAEQDALAATSPEQLKRFVAERLAAGDYLRHLGLLHTVRGDMDKLGQLLSPSGLAKVLPGGETPVQRIILYIDDLDRCPPQRVVEVLEAIHLLLAFPLFVVIVGVDIRWVQQALCKRYPRLLGKGEGVASAMDYLEKVFQIPFWLPPLNSAGGAKLLEAAIGPVESAAQEGATAGQGRNGGGPSEPTRKDPRDEKPEINADLTRQQDQSSKVPPPITLTAEALMLTADEAAYAKNLIGVVSISPRRTKRFANLYRVLKGSLSPVERRRLAYPTNPGEGFRSPLFLLALLTGAPKAASQLIAQLTTPSTDPAITASSKPLQDILASIKPPPDEAEALKAATLLIKDEPLEAHTLENLRYWASKACRFAFSERGA